jgi:hypothetical protein
MWTKAMPAYYYHFSHEGSFSLADVFGKSGPELLSTILWKMVGNYDPINLGTCHADDLMYLFR